ncbi:signal peptidase I [Geodermatophilus sp. SYSU D00742]
MTAVLPLATPGTAPPPLPTARARRPATGRLLRPALRLVTRWLVRLLIGTAVLAFLGLAVGPHLLGYRTLTMLTGSMAPAIDTGDIVLTTPLDVTDVREGMIITYHIPVGDRSLVTHRVLTVDHAADGTVTVQTKGDANDAPDPWTAVLQGDTAYQVQAVIPAAGHLITALRTPWLSHLLVYGAPTLLAGWLLLTIWRPTTHTQEDRP